AALEQVRPLTDARRHEVSVSLPEQPVHVLADRARLTQAISNLLTNAAKYTPPEGQLRVSVSAADADVCIDVQDNGEGISAELMPEIFDLFTQGARSVDRHE